MRDVDPGWRVMVAVCGHERRQRTCCGAHGSQLWKCLKDQLRERDLGDRVLAARTSCLGVCPEDGVTVSIHKGDRPLCRPDVVVVSSEAEPEECARRLLDRMGL